MDSSSAVLFIYLLQCAGAVFVTAMLFYFYALYQRSYLLHWGQSWLAFALFLVYAALAPTGVELYPSSHPVRLIGTFLGLGGAYIHVLWLVLGTLELTQGRRYSRRTLIQLVAAVGGVVLLMTLAFVGSEEASTGRYVTRVLLRTFLSGVGYGSAALILLRHDRTLRYFGRILVILALLGFGGAQLYMTAIVGYNMFAGGYAFNHAAWIGSFELMMQTVVGVGLVVWLLEEERANLQDATKALKQSERRFRELFESSPDAVYVNDMTGRILDANAAACHLHGVSRDALIGRQMTELLPSEDLETIRAVYEHDAEGELLRFECSCRVGEDGLMPVEAHVRRIMLDRRPALLFQVRDITDRKEYEQDLIEAKEYAEAMNRFKTAFLNNLSHEIRTPLTTIIGFSEILMHESEGSARELGGLIAEGGTRLLHTLESLFDLSMLEAGHYQLDPMWFDPNALTRERIATARGQAEAKGIALRYVAPAGIPEVWLDRTCLSRILSHLIDNAVKFTDDGYVEVVLQVGMQGLYVRISDTGIGIDPSFQPHLFHAFKQESTGLTRTYVGAGVGLAITKHMIDLVGGEIVASSAKHSGSVFEVRIPCNVRWAQRMGDGGAEGDPELRVRPPGRPAILAVDDQTEVFLLLQHILKDGYDLLTARTEEEALSLLRRQPVDLVLMDINLERERTGADALEALRAMPRYRGVPVIAMTAYALPRERKEFLAAGFDGYLSKPFNAGQALSLIREMLARPIDDGGAGEVESRPESDTPKRAS